VSGKPIINASRLVDAAAFKEAVTGHEEAILGVIVSPFVYETNIEPGGSPLDPAGYTQIPVRVKETTGAAWAQLIGPAGPLALPPLLLTRAVHVRGEGAQLGQVQLATSGRSSPCSRV